MTGPSGPVERLAEASHALALALASHSQDGDEIMRAVAALDKAVGLLPDDVGFPAGSAEQQQLSMVSTELSMTRAHLLAAVDYCTRLLLAWSEITGISCSPGSAKRPDIRADRVHRAQLAR